MLDPSTRRQLERALPAPRSGDSVFRIGCRSPEHGCITIGSLSLSVRRRGEWMGGHAEISLGGELNELRTEASVGPAVWALLPLKPRSYLSDENWPFHN